MLELSGSTGCAEFMARMIMKYGDKILRYIEAEKAMEAAVK